VGGVIWRRRQKTAARQNCKAAYIAVAARPAAAARRKGAKTEDIISG